MNGLPLARARNTRDRYQPSGTVSPGLSATFARLATSQGAIGIKARVLLCLELSQAFRREYQRPGGAEVCVEGRSSSAEEETFPGPAPFVSGEDLG